MNFGQSKSDPVSGAIYAKENRLLSLPGWKIFTRLARHQKKLMRLSTQDILQSFRAHTTYKFGVQVPRNHTDAVELDKKNRES